MNLKTIALAALAAALSVGCVNRAAQEQAKKTQAIVTSPKKAVAVEDVQSRDIDETLEVTGELATSQDVQVGAKVGGRLSVVYVKDGDRVSAGQLLAEVDGANQRIQVQQAQAQVSAANAALAQAKANAVVGPSRSSAALAQAQAQLRSARAQLQKALNGARPEERAQADAAVAAAKSNMDTAQKELERVRSLFNEQVVSQQRLDQAENAFNGARAQYQQALEQQRLTQNIVRPEDIESARESVRQAEEAVRTADANKRLDVLLTQQVQAAQANLNAARAQLALAQQSLNDLQVRAPYAGQVSGRPLQAGTVVAPGSPIVRIVGGEGTYFEGDLPATMLAQVRAGGTVQVAVDGLADQTFPGTLSSISPSASSIGRIFKARITLSSTPAGVRPGMFARGTVVLRTVRGATVVPTGALLKRGDRTVVFVVDGNKAKEVTVVPGLRTNGLTQVSGVEPGAKVVVSGQSDLETGAELDIQSKKADGGQA